MNIKWHDRKKECMKVRERDGVTVLTWPELEKLTDYAHCFTTRLGGVSTGIYSSMNLSFTRGDRDEDVRENFRRISHVLGFEPEDIVTSDQTHTTNVRRISEEDRGCGVTKPRRFMDVDGLVTNVPGILLATFYADCVPLYFVDPEKKAIGLSHSGWRGTAGRMGAATVKMMKREFGTNPADLYAAVGPSICQECYEVSEDVIDAFRKSFSPQQEGSLFYRKENGKYQLNLWEANRIVLQEAGIPEERIFLPNLCTCCNPEFLFSHRATRGKRGNLAAFLGIIAGSRD